MALEDAVRPLGFILRATESHWFKQESDKVISSLASDGNGCWEGRNGSWQSRWPDLGRGACDEKG